MGLIYSKTGLLASYGAQYAEGFAVGLDYATHHTGMAGGHKIVVTERDDAGDPAKAVAAAKELIGQGYKILAGSTASGVALQSRRVAKENNVLFISGPAAADAMTGNNRNTFRSGRQTYQDVLTAGTIVGNNMRGKKVVVYAQDSAFGQANVNAVRAVLGGGRRRRLGGPGAALGQRLRTVLAEDQGRQTGSALPRLGRRDRARDVEGARRRGDFRGDQGRERAGPARVVPDARLGRDQDLVPVALLLRSAQEQGATTRSSPALKKDGKVPDLFDPDGFVAAQMIVHAIEKADGDDVGKMISALEDWTFDAPKGTQTIRAADHAMLQPMFVAKLQGSGSSLAPKLVRTVPLQAVSPPVRPFK